MQRLVATITRDEAAAVCDLLGLEVLQVANEGRLILFLPEDRAAAALAVLRGAGSSGAVLVGRVEGAIPRVTLRTVVGARRVFDIASGVMLPRIC